MVWLSSLQAACLALALYASSASLDLQPNLTSSCTGSFQCPDSPAPQVFNAYTKIFPTPPPSRHAKRASPRAATGHHDRDNKHPTAKRKLGETCTLPQKPAKHKAEELCSHSALHQLAQQPGKSLPSVVPPPASGLEATLPI